MDWIQLLATVLAAMIGAALVAAVAFMYYTARTVGRGIDAATDTGARAIDATAGAITNLVDKGAAVAAPLTEGARDLLGSIADRIRVKQHELNDLAAKNVALAQEIERLSTRHIDVTQVTSQLKLGLIEVSQQYYSFQRKRLSVDGGGTFSSATAVEYLGLQRADYRSQIGVDLERLRFALLADNVIQVHGLRDLSILGLKTVRLQKLVDELRQMTLDAAGKPKAIEVLLRDDRREEQSVAHHDCLLEEIQTADSVQHFAGAVAEFGLAFLQACLGAGGYKIVEAMQPLDVGVTFLELCQAINERLARAISAAQESRRELQNASHVLQTEMVEMIQSP